MATAYPSGLDDWGNPDPTTRLDDPTLGHAQSHSNLNDAVEAIQGELGISPSGVYGTVAARLAGSVRTVAPEAYGAVGDGTTDDTTALVATLAAMTDGSVLLLTQTYRHTDNLTVTGLTGITVTGGGTLAHVSDAAETGGLRFAGCSNVLVSGVKRTSTATTRRGDGNDQGLNFDGCTYVRVEDVEVDGSAAAGIFVYNTDHFWLTGCTVSNTLADSFHITNTSRYGRLDRCVSSASGDDGFGIVSYESNGAQCEDITVTNCSVLSQVGGRGLAVVGGKNIRFADCHVYRSFNASIYVACEAGGYNTYGVQGARFDRIELEEGVQNSPTTGHATVMVFSERSGAGYAMSDIHFSDIRFVATKASVDDEVFVYPASTGYTFSNITLAGLRMTDSARGVWLHANLPAGAVTQVWAFSGAVRANDVIGSTAPIPVEWWGKPLQLAARPTSANVPVGTVWYEPGSGGTTTELWGGTDWITLVA